MAHYRSWTTDDVGKWLTSIHMEHLVYKFEMLNVNGEKLDDPNLLGELRLNPGEKTVFPAALKTLKDSHSAATLVDSRPRLMSNNDRKAKTTPRKKEHLPQPQCQNSKGPDLIVGPASQLLESDCKHSGWIRKAGTSGKGWRHRYLVLRRGHCYYYENERSKLPKGYFSLHCYKVEKATEDDVKRKNRPWTIKLVHSDPDMRKYLIQTAAKHEMDKWVEVLEEEVRSFEGNSNEDTDEDEGHYEHLYDPVAYDDDEDDMPLYDTVAADDDTDDPDHDYTKITDFTSPQEPPHSPTHVRGPPPPPRPQQSHTLPQRPNLHIRSGGGDSPAIHRSSVGSSLSAPMVLPRSKESLTRSIESESPYLQITGEGRSSSYSSGSSLRHDGPPITTLHHHHILDNHNSIEGEEEEEENPYYIDLKKTTELAPDHCIFDNISREEAESRLIKTGRKGTYLLRDGTHKDAKYVLSVWTGSKAKHYKLYYKDGEDEYCLTEGQSFRKINDLLANYKEEDLPRSPGIRLSDPYHPLDH